MNLKRFLLGMVLTIMAPLAFAQASFEENGIMYQEDLSDPSKMAVYVVGNTNSLTGTSKYSGDIVIPAKVEHDLDTYEVIGIAQGAFTGEGVNSIVIRDGVKTIAPYAIFTPSLKKLVIPGSIKTLDGVMCLGLEEVQFENGIESISNFFYGPKLKRIKIPDSIKNLSQIGPGYNPEGVQEGLEEIIFGKGIENISISFFYFYGRCLDIPGSINKIEASFYICPELREVTFNKGTKEIMQAFCMSPFLTSLKLPDGIETISGSFCGDSSLKEVIFPNTLNTISGSFNDCTSLENIDFTKFSYNLNTIDNSFNGCISLENIDFTKLPDLKISNSFRNCDTLKKLVLPNNLTNLHGSFWKTSIEELTIGPNCYDINNILNLNNKLNVLKCSWTEIPDVKSAAYLLSRMRDRHPDNQFILKVPKGMSDDYTKAWGLDKVYVDTGEKIYKGLTIIEE